MIRFKTSHRIFYPLFLVSLAFYLQSCAGPQSGMEGYDDTDSYQPMSSQDIQEESFGQKAEEADKPREALVHYVKALQSAPEGSQDDQRLKEKIITLAQGMQPPPAVPPKVLEYEGGAEAAVKNATTPEDYLVAAKKYQQAIKLAPWVANYYFNLGVVQEKADQPAKAARNFTLYLLANPNASEAKDVRKKIGELKYQEERLKANPAERLAGQWWGYIPDSNLFKKQIFKIEAVRDTLKVILINSPEDPSYFMGKDAQIGDTIFELTLEERRLHGKVIYNQHVSFPVDLCNQVDRKGSAEGNLSANGSTIDLSFFTEYSVPLVAGRGNNARLKSCDPPEGSWKNFTLRRIK